MRIEILHIGDELLTGQTDPYPAEIVRDIRGKGAYLSRIAVIPDLVEEIMAEFGSARTRGTNLLVVTGGLGPTLDDVTRHALARFLGTELIVVTDAVEWMKEGLLRFHQRLPEITEAGMLMAKVPSGTKALRNPVGVACGIEAQVGHMTIFCYPGFPREMLAMFREYTLPRIISEGLVDEEMRVFRRETTLEPIFQTIVREFQVRVASLPMENARQVGNVVIIKGKRAEVERAKKRFLEMVDQTKDEWDVGQGTK
jgi:nicotinamide-nucleotide amidase